MSWRDQVKERCLTLMDDMDYGACMIDLGKERDQMMLSTSIDEPIVDNFGDEEPFPSNRYDKYDPKSNSHPSALGLIAKVDGREVVKSNVKVEGLGRLMEDPNLVRNSSLHFILLHRNILCDNIVCIW